MGAVFREVVLDIDFQAQDFPGPAQKIVQPGDRLGPCQQFCRRLVQQREHLVFLLCGLLALAQRVIRLFALDGIADNALQQ